MASTVYYRYIYDPHEAQDREVTRIRDERVVKATNPTAVGTWYSPNRYDNPQDAQQFLALQNVPSHRIGPIPADEMPDFDIGLRPVAPVTLPNGTMLPGGGVEVRTKGEVLLLGLYKFDTPNVYIPLHP